MYQIELTRDEFINLDLSILKRGDIIIVKEDDWYFYDGQKIVPDNEISDITGIPFNFCFPEFPRKYFVDFTPMNSSTFIHLDMNKFEKSEIKTCRFDELFLTVNDNILDRYCKFIILKYQDIQYILFSFEDYFEKVVQGEILIVFDIHDVIYDPIDGYIQKDIYLIGQIRSDFYEHIFQYH